MEIRYRCKKFSDLSVFELYAIMRLRQEVFILEQDCNYLDADGRDEAGIHILGEDEYGNLHCYARLLPEGIPYEGYVSIGRVINSKAVRRRGEGEKLMRYAMQQVKKYYDDTPVKISAQSYLLNFYRKFGFETVGEEYLEDDIPHTAMISKGLI
jgi:ElaA protein